MDSRGILTAAATAACVAAGIFLLVHFRPTPEYWREWSFQAHAAGVVCLLAACSLVGWIATRNLARALLLGLGGLFLAAGTLMWANGALDRSKPVEILFQVTDKERYYVQQSRNSHWEYYLQGQAAGGRRFRFATNVGNVSMQEWEAAVAGRGDVVVVQEHPGALGIPWWRILGLRTSSGSSGVERPGEPVPRSGTTLHTSVQ